MGCNGSKNAAAATGAKPAAEAAKVDFEITLERKTAEQALGLSVVDAAPGLTVEALKEEGMVPDFHKANENTPDKHLKKGDKIIAVNGVCGDSEQIKKELAQAQATTFVLGIQRAVTAEATPAEAAKEVATEAPATTTAQEEMKTEPAGAEAAATAAPTAEEAPATTAAQEEKKTEQAGPEEAAAPTAEEAAKPSAPEKATAAPEEAEAPAAENADTSAKDAEVAPVEGEALAEDAATEEKATEPVVESEEAKAKAGQLELDPPLAVPVAMPELEVEGAPEVEKQAMCRFLC